MGFLSMMIWGLPLWIWLLFIALFLETMFIMITYAMTPAGIWLKARLKGYPVVLTYFRDKYARFYVPKKAGSITVTKNGAYLTPPDAVVPTNKGHVVLTYDLFGLAIPPKIMKLIEGAREKGISNYALLDLFVKLEDIKNKILTNTKLTDEENKLLKEVGYDENSIKELDTNMMINLFESVRMYDLWHFFTKNIDAAATKSLIEQEVAEKMASINEGWTFNKVLTVLALIGGLVVVGAIAYVIIKSVGGSGTQVVKEVVRTATTTAVNGTIPA